MPSAIFQEKKKFQKAYRIYDTKEDFKMDQQHRFAFASDPSRDTIVGLMNVMTTTPDDLDLMTEQEKVDLHNKFYYFVSEVTIDSDIDGLNFEDAEKAEESFDHPDVDWHFMYQVYGNYIAQLLTKHQELGKVFSPLADNEDFGTDNNKKEKQPPETPC